ncbi:hypothetical protein D9M72_547110 [compost metagenome]
MPFRLNRLLQFQENFAQLIPDVCLYGGFLNLLKQRERLLIVRARFLQLTLRQCECAQMPEVHALSSQIAELLRNL